MGIIIISAADFYCIKEKKEEMQQVIARTKEEGEKVAMDLEANKRKKLLYVLEFYRSDCPATEKSRTVMDILLNKRAEDRTIRRVILVDQAIHPVKRYLHADDLMRVPSILLWSKGRRRWFLALHADGGTVEDHFARVARQLLRKSVSRAGGTAEARAAEDEEDSPIFFTYFFSPVLRNDPVHLTIIGALTLLQEIRKTPVAYRPSADLNMHSVLIVHGPADHTYSGNAAARYLSTLLEVNERLGFLSSVPELAGMTNRAGGSEACWADVLTGLTVTAALLA